MKMRIGWVLAGAIALAGLLEIGVRAAGLVDFPLYNADNRIGYIPKPNQSGSFMNKNGWDFNDLSMGTARPFSPSDDTMDILLIGDSVVFGGNPYRQEDRLGPQLARATGEAVWPISAGSWGLQNQLAYLADHPDVVRGADQIVFVLNGGDFGEPSSWRSEMTHPRTRPISAVVYLISKYIIKPTGQEAPADLLVAKSDWRSGFDAWARDVAAPITVVLYPDRVGRDDFSPGEVLLTLGADRLVLLGDDERWTSAMYRDDIHPTVDGTALLADIIAENLR